MYVCLSTFKPQGEYMGNSYPVDVQPCARPAQLPRYSSMHMLLLCRHSREAADCGQQGRWVLGGPGGAADGSELFSARVGTVK